MQVLGGGFTIVHGRSTDKTESGQRDYLAGATTLVRRLRLGLAFGYQKTLACFAVVHQSRDDRDHIKPFGLNCPNQTVVMLARVTDNLRPHQ